MDKYDLDSKEYKEIVNLKDFKIPINKDQHLEKAEQWPIWKLAIENALASAGWELDFGLTMRGEASLLNAIIATCKGEALSIVRRCNCGSIAFKRLEERFHGSLSLRKDNILAEFDSLNLRTWNYVPTFIERFQTIMFAYTEAEGVLPDDILFHYLSRAVLPIGEDWFHQTRQLHRKGLLNYTIHEYLEDLAQYANEMQLKSKPQGKEKSKEKSKKQQDSDSSGSQTPAKQQNKPAKSNITCNHCNKKGHKEAECWKKHGKPK